MIIPTFAALIAVLGRDETSEVHVAGLPPLSWFPGSVASLW